MDCLKTKKKEQLKTIRSTVVKCINYNAISEQPRDTLFNSNAYSFLKKVDQLLSADMGHLEFDWGCVDVEFLVNDPFFKDCLYSPALIKDNVKKLEEHQNNVVKDYFKYNPAYAPTRYKLNHTKTDTTSHTKTDILNSIITNNTTIDAKRTPTPAKTILQDEDNSVFDYESYSNQSSQQSDDTPPTWCTESAIGSSQS